MKYTMSSHSFVKWTIGFSLVMPFFIIPLWAQHPQTEQAYFQVLSQADEETFASEYETPFLMLLDAQQVKQYERFQDLKKRKDMIIYCWHAWNPNPLLAENEYLRGYLQRYIDVREQCAMDNPPYFDDRGRYYLRFGKPTQRFVQGAQFRRVKQFDKGEGYFRASHLLSYRDDLCSYRLPTTYRHVSHCH